MTEKFTYYIDFGTGFEKVDIHKNDLSLNHIVSEEHEGFAVKELEGSFVLKGNDFARIKTINDSSINKYIPIRIYRDNDAYLVFDGYFNNYNNFDFNEKTVVIKQFFQSVDYYNEILAYWEKDFTIYPEWWTLFGAYPNLPIYTDISYNSVLITEYSYSLVNVLNSLIIKSNGLLSLYFDSSDFWYNANNAKFDVNKFRIASLTDINGYGTGAGKKISLKRLFEILEAMFKIYWYIDLVSFKLKFKTVADFNTSNVDFTDKTTDKKLKVYNYGLNYKSESISFNENNLRITGDDYRTTNNIVYQNLAKSAKEYNLTEVCTRYIEGVENLSNDGFFFGYVDEITNKLIPGGGIKSVTNIDNAKFCPANLIHENYRDYMYCNDINFTHNGEQSGYIPRRIKPFIELPEISTILDAPENFIDSFIFDIQSGNTTIARVWEQRTDLNTNITTFKSYEFLNTKNTDIPPPPPPPPPPVDHYITVDPSAATFDENGGNIDIDVSSDTSWDVTCSANWVTIDQISGTGNDTINISVTSTTVARVATVIFTDGVINTYLYVSQSVTIVEQPTISVTPGYHDINRSAQSITLTIVTTQAWTITNPLSWVHFASLSGSGNAVITMDVDSSTIDRTGTITFGISGASTGIYINQHQIDIELTISPESLNFAYNGETKSFDVITTGTWSLSSSQSWCTVDSNSGTGNTTINVTCSASLLARNCVITVTNGTYTRYLSVVQDGEPPYIYASPSNVGFNTEGGNINVDISSNVNWTCSATDQWITLDRISGSGNGVLNISVGSTIITRNSSVVITDGTIVRTIIVGQTYVAPVPTISVTPGYNNVGLGATTIQLTITTTESWTISNPLSWVHFPGGTSGSGNATITMEIDYAASPRSGTVTFNITGASSGVYITQH